MFGPLGKFWRSLKRYPLLLLLAGLVAGAPIGWLLGSRSVVEKIAIPPAKATTYTALSNDELKNKSAQLVTAIRSLVRSYHDEDNRMRSAADESSGKTDSQAERERLRKTWLDDSAKLLDGFMDRYKANFWADALLLRQAIVAKVG